MLINFNFSIHRAGCKINFLLIFKPMKSCACFINMANVKNDVSDRIYKENIARKQTYDTLVGELWMEGNASDPVLKLVSAYPFESFRSISQVVEMDLASQISTCDESRIAIYINSTACEIKNLLLKSFT